MLVLVAPPWYGLKSLRIIVMKDLTTIIPSDLKERAKYNPAGYWELPPNIYITSNESIMIAIIDSAVNDTLVVFWDETEQCWFNYTNCFGVGVGDDAITRIIISEWVETVS